MGDKEHALSGRLMVVRYDSTCTKCQRNVLHPWHDNGDATPWTELWYKGGMYGTPIMYTKENGYQ